MIVGSKQPSIKFRAFPLIPPPSHLNSHASPTPLVSPVSYRSLFTLLPQMDADNLLRDGGGGGGSGVADRDGKSGSEQPVRRQPPQPPEEDPDLPPESIQVPIGGDGVDWTYLNAVFERDDSTKGSTNPKCAQANPKSRSISELSSASLRAKPHPVIGLPNSIRAPGFAARSSRPPQTTTGRIFPKKSARSGGGSAAEPGSPKVSCFGKVRSDRERKRGKGRGCWPCSLEAVFGRGGRGRAAGEGEGRAGKIGSPPSAATARTAPWQGEQAAGPGLGGMKRFASGRRAASWGEEAEEEEGQVRRRHPERAVMGVEDKAGGAG
ncbi:hypothetical protein Cni_G26526 [Canna indica]|uniref:Uncharacterized protein n=1 Tax=Canna indica TaxID=4628 RepID=A0AAQ3KZ74_9LILI|nr:hypothetical protein Cni_G26526 [Canna indica]